MGKGTLIVIDGIDGSGKSTQIELLKKYYARKATPFEAISFPRYGQNVYADLVKRYLEGEFGNINDINPYLISLAYAGDRMLAKPLIEEWLKSGKVVIANRYVSSNKAHQGANLSFKEREKFIKWVDELEYKTNGLPKEDLTILLDVNPTIGQQNVQSRDIADLLENDLNHLIKANKIYLELVKKEKNWVVVNCMGNGKMRSIEQIHKEILEILNGQIFRD